MTDPYTLNRTNCGYGYPWNFQWCLNQLRHEKELVESKNYPTMAEYDEDILTQSDKQQTVLDAIGVVNDVITGALKYIPSHTKSEMEEKLNIYRDNLPTYVKDIKPIYVWTFEDHWKEVSHSRRRWGRRSRWRHWHSRWYSKLDRYNYKKNVNFDNQIQTYIDQINAIKNDIPKFIFNFCLNENSLLNKEGLQSCGLNKVIQDFRDSIKVYKDKSNTVMSKIKNTKKFPQFKQAKKVDNFINSCYDWYPMDERSTYNTGYAKLTLSQIKAKIKMWSEEIPLLYDQCVLKDTHVGLDDNDIPICVRDDYLKSAEKCGQAIQMSNTYDYGTDKLTALWIDVSNSIPGNISRQSSLILNTGNDSCKKWVDMFNLWEELEEKALAEPCAPERPIASTNDAVLVKMADDWNKSATDLIKQLKARLMKIQKYIQDYPNILDIKKDGVVLAPHSMTATAIIKKDFSQSKEGEAPKQYLEMIVPNGKPGEQGELGIVGIAGENGRSGLRGPEGSVGDINVPSFYNMFNKN